MWRCSTRGDKQYICGPKKEASSCSRNQKREVESSGQSHRWVFFIYFFIHDNKERDDGRKMYVVWISVDDNETNIHQPHDPQPLDK